MKVVYAGRRVLALVTGSTALIAVDVARLTLPCLEAYGLNVDVFEERSMPHPGRGPAVPATGPSEERIVEAVRCCTAFVYGVRPSVRTEEGRYYRLVFKPRRGDSRGEEREI